MLINAIKLMRPKHYVKNLLVFIPLIFSGQLFNFDKFASVFEIFVLFSFVASAVYIINDIKDVRRDQKHPVKKHRPIASGSFEKTHALVLSIILLITCLVLGLVWRLDISTAALIALYFFINLA